MEEAARRCGFGAIICKIEWARRCDAARPFSITKWKTTKIGPGAKISNQNTTPTSEVIMRLFLGLVLFVTGAFPVLADAACESEFRRLMQQGNAGFPYAATIRTEFAGKVTEVSTTVVGAAHSMTLSDEHGLRSINKGNRIWMSTDKGKSWKLAHTLPKDTVDKASAMLTRQASIATDITCTDGTEVGGKKYRLVQGKFTTDKTNFPALQKFYVTGPGETWQVAVTELSIAGKPSIVTTTKTKSGEGVTIPEVDK